MHNDQTVRPLLGFRLSKMKLDFDYGVYGGVETIFSCARRKISLQSYMGNYVAVESDGTVTQSAAKDRRTVFSVDTLEWRVPGLQGVPCISLKSHLGKYLGTKSQSYLDNDCAQIVELNAHGEAKSPGRVFYLVPHRQGKVALYTDCTRFLSADGERVMKATRVDSGDSVWFLPECVGEILISKFSFPYINNISNTTPQIKIFLLKNTKQNRCTSTTNRKDDYQYNTYCPPKNRRHR